MITTSVFTQNLIAYNRGVRRIVNKGGTWSSKNFSILQLLILIAQKKDNYVISVVSESLPHLKKGAIADFEKILKDDNKFSEDNWNRSDFKYHFGSTYIEFFSADQPGKATGPRRNILYLNEIINIPYTVVEQLELRTIDTIFCDYNPMYDFWINEKIFTLPQDEYILIKSNYLDAIEVLPPSIVKEIERKAATDPNFKRVHVDVESGMVEGLIFPDFRLVDSMPVTDRSANGLDFGFTNDVTAYVNVRINNGELWINELLYETGLTNPDIANFIKGEGKQREDNIADSAEPKSIEELRRMGINVVGAQKGPDSVSAGIDWMKSFSRINVTKRSVNVIKEFRYYKWKVDNNGKALNVPVDLWNHGIDGARMTRQVFQQPKAKPRVTVV